MPAAAKARGAARTNHLIECALFPPKQGHQRPVFWRYNLSAHHDSTQSPHSKPHEALVGALERDLVKTVGDRKGRLTKKQKKRLSALQQLPATAEAATEAAAATAAAAAEAAAAGPAPG